MTTSTQRRQTVAPQLTMPETDVHSGHGAELFSSGSLNHDSRGDMIEGAGASLFSSGSAPRADRAMTSGAVTGLFSSGS
ncbi:DUF6749 family protein [Phaeobacter gallaeciensis]|uniref:DUF6749 family protein n=1 Tax=Phaeobacter gallaeciensis TaxID=60890 RepID=UPI000BBC3A8D|nr:DUF6749 family protein [Phaeobacter gallaeciensis]ATF18849.1 hypothetical protein PhaeoP129_02227 [Phaeobacter gallaeciensis]ATF22958.1 hypothetical protein PhaeoP128_02227 [Phaeobacter gallaeciensis]